MAKSRSDRILSTPSSYARRHFLYVQEVGTLESIEPHISRRQNLESFLFFLVISGSGRLYYNGSYHQLKAGDCILIDCRLGYAHESSPDDAWTLMWVHFYGQEAPSFYQLYLEQSYPFLFRPLHLDPFTSAISSLYAVQKEESSLTELISHKLLTELLTSCFLENQRETSLENTIQDKMNLIRTYIETHSTEKISLDELSGRFFISKYHLSREYKRIHGITIGQDLTARRISHAKSLLRFSSDSIEEIAIHSGFQDAAYFIKVFKKLEGSTPLEYRRKW